MCSSDLIIATVITAGFLGVFAWMLLGKVESTYSSNQVSSEIAFQLWPFHLAAALGIVCAAIMALIRLWRLIRPMQGV